MNGFPGGATDGGSDFTDEDDAVFPAVFLWIYRFAADTRTYFGMLRRDTAGLGANGVNCLMSNLIDAASFENLDYEMQKSVGWLNCA